MYEKKVKNVQEDIREESHVTHGKRHEEKVKNVQGAAPVAASQEEEAAL